ncbi:integrating conjugative element membrane protein [Pseudomonas luteola]|uniref:Integrating conjugative element membrane protein n=1 Tax=Pseudomonas luteola TaxID=47886 RepID=A0A2X2C3G6_PSELU|nr:TIGR03745 family integrating conjugative element membrane protein [Pseudomonas luteola]SPZ02567.1 integrating conjugative element membrane protein [Pseudomonas luteola]
MKTSMLAPARNIRSRFSSGYTRFGLALMSGLAAVNPAFAAMPTSEAPTKGEGSNMMTTIKNYGFDAITILALALAAGAFLAVAYHANGVYAGIHTKKNTWGDFGLCVGVGGALLVVIIWLLTKATDIMT